MASMNSHRRCSFVPFVTQITVQPLLEVSASPPNRLSSSGCATIMTFDGLGTPAREEKTSSDQPIGTSSSDRCLVSRESSMLVRYRHIDRYAARNVSLVLVLDRITVSARGARQRDTGWQR